MQSILPPQSTTEVPYVDEDGDLFYEATESRIDCDDDKNDLPKKTPSYEDSFRKALRLDSLYFSAAGTDVSGTIFVLLCNIVSAAAQTIPATFPSSFSSAVREAMKRASPSLLNYTASVLYNATWGPSPTSIKQFFASPSSTISLTDFASRADLSDSSLTISSDFASSVQQFSRSLVVINALPGGLSLTLSNPTSLGLKWLCLNSVFEVAQDGMSYFLQPLCPTFSSSVPSSETNKFLVSFSSASQGVSVKSIDIKDSSHPLFFAVSGTTGGTTEISVNAHSSLQNVTFANTISGTVNVLVSGASNFKNIIARMGGTGFLKFFSQSGSEILCGSSLSGGVDSGKLLCSLEQPEVTSKWPLVFFDGAAPTNAPTVAATSSSALVSSSTSAFATNSSSSSTGALVIHTSSSQPLTNSSTAVGGATSAISSSATALATSALGFFNSTTQFVSAIFTSAVNNATSAVSIFTSNTTSVIASTFGVSSSTAISFPTSSSQPLTNSSTAVGGTTSAISSSATALATSALGLFNSTTQFVSAIFTSAVNNATSAVSIFTSNASSVTNISPTINLLSSTPPPQVTSGVSSSTAAISSSAQPSASARRTTTGSSLPSTPASSFQGNITSSSSALQTAMQLTSTPSANGPDLLITWKGSNYNFSNFTSNSLQPAALRGFMFGVISSACVIPIKELAEKFLHRDFSVKNPRSSRGGKLLNSGLKFLADLAVNFTASFLPTAASMAFIEGGYKTPQELPFGYIAASSASSCVLLTVVENVIGRATSRNAISSGATAIVLFFSSQLLTNASAIACSAAVGTHGNEMGSNEHLVQFATSFATSALLHFLYESAKQKCTKQRKTKSHIPVKYLDDNQSEVAIT